MARGTEGFTHSPTGTASEEGLAESARLTAAFARFDFRVPSGVTASPAKPELCAIDNSWGTRFTLRKGDDARVVFLEVTPRHGQDAGSCRGANCHVSIAEDGAVVRSEQSPPSMPTELKVNAVDRRSQLPGEPSVGHAAELTEHLAQSKVLPVNTVAADGTQVMITCVNRSAEAEAVNNPGATRPEPPLSMSDLLRIAGMPDLRW
jgi:hypothetical protein